MRNFTKYFYRSEDGSILALTAIFLPVVLLIGGLIVDGGRLYIRESELKNLARHSSNSAIIEIGDRLTTLAGSNKTSLCSVEFPPSVCSSNDIFDFVDRADFESVILSVENQNSFKQAGIDFAINHDPEAIIEDSDVTVLVPFEYDSNVNQIKVKVSISRTPDLIFNTLIPQRSLTVEAQSYLKTAFN